MSPEHLPLHTAGGGEVMKSSGEKHHTDGNAGLPHRRPSAGASTLAGAHENGPVSFKIGRKQSHT